MIAFCPIIPGTDRFEPRSFKGKAVALRIDNPSGSHNINEDGHAVIIGGKWEVRPVNRHGKPIYSRK